MANHEMRDKRDFHQENINNAKDSNSNNLEIEAFLRLIENIGDANERFSEMTYNYIHREEIASRKLAEKIRVAKEEEEKRLRIERKRKIIVAAILCVAVTVLILISFIITNIIIPSQKYNTAVAYMNEGSYTTAFSMFLELDGFKNSSELADSCLYEINETSYANALSYMEDGEYEKAINLLIKTKAYSYKDSERLIEKCQNALKQQTYDNAVIMIEQEKYESAIVYLQEIRGYKDSDNLIRKCEQLQLVYPIRMAEIGERVTFGSYEQDGDSDNGAEKITWIVLDKTDNSALLLSEYGLDYVNYYEAYSPVTWETCSLRQWMNETFLNSAFTKDELSAIEIVKVEAEKTSGFDTDPGNDTNDRIFALSFNEAEVLFQSNEERRCKPTKAAIRNKAYKDNAGYGLWWLRSPGSNRSYATLIDEEGVIREHYVNGFEFKPRYVGLDWDYGNTTARPAMWVKFK